MRPWTISRSQQIKFPEGSEIISTIYLKEGVLCRDDILAPADLSAFPAPAQALGWWRWVMRKRPPTQKELNERLERLLFSLKDSTAAHKETLTWLICLYLTRKRIMRQQGATFTHIKSAEVFQTNPEAMEGMEGAMTALLEAIN